MSTARLQPDQQSIEAEACAWIAQLDGTEPSAEDLEALGEWMQRSPAHREAIERLSSLWNDLNVMTELAVPRTVDASDHRRRRSDTLFSRRSRTVAAFAAMLLLSVAALFTLRGSDTTPQSEAVALSGQAQVRTGSFRAAVGQQQVINLADGSRVTLNTNSQVVVDLNSISRDIYLVKGEALFEVAKNRDREFRVYAGSGLVRALGTVFAVYLKGEDSVSVSVTEGVVELAVLSSSVIDTSHKLPEDSSHAPLAKVSAGQIAEFGSDLQSIQSIGKDEISRRLAWREGMLRFDGDPLFQVVQEVSRYTTQEIVIRDPAIRNLRIGGYFKAGETDAMLEALETGFGVRVERVNENVVHLVKN